VHVIATAGHVDHGKSTLVRALTGTDPDRLAEEQRRGMTLDLGFAWAEVSGGTIAFVDVPGHERFVPTMLAGVGPVPAALVVVAADGGWMPQTEEHVAALDALQVRHAVVAVSRADLADPAPVAADVAERLAGTTLSGAVRVPVSAATGEGLDLLRSELASLARRLPAPDVEAPVRLWVDRSFTVRGAGTVVTGTLPAGTLRTGDVLEVAGRRVVVRGLQSLGRPADEVAAVARVAVNLRGVDPEDVRRGTALLTPGAWTATGTLDARVDPGARLPAHLMAHAGSAAVPVHVRPLGTGGARLRLAAPLPLRVGDRVLLREPSRHQAVTPVVVLDTDPPQLARRGAAAARGRELQGLDGASELRRRGVARSGDLARLGVPAPVAPLAGDWLVDPGHAKVLRGRVAEVVADHARSNPLDSGPTVEAVRRALGLPDRALVGALLSVPLEIREGRVVDPARSPLPERVGRAVAALARDLEAAPFLAPDADRLTELGLGPRELAAAERVGAVLRVATGVVLLPDAPERAAHALEALGRPFTVADARTALGTTRRVAVPLLEMLDRQGVTQRLPDDRRTVRAPHG
jgi:selenocysteine-specific elongation factor